MVDYNDVVDYLRTAGAQRRSIQHNRENITQNLGELGADGTIELSRDLRAQLIGVTDRAVAHLGSLISWTLCERAIDEADADWIYPEIMQRASEHVHDKQDGEVS